MRVTKTADTSAFSNPVSAGDVITYTITAENTGNVTLDNVSIADSLTPTSGSSSSLTPTIDATATGTADDDSELDVGETWTWTVSYTLVQSDIDAGGLSNLATVTADDPSDTSVSVESSTSGNTTSGTGNGTGTSTTLAQLEGIALVKTATLRDDDGKLGVTVGDTILYTFVVKNTGNVTLTNISIDDPLIDVTGTIQSIAPGTSDNSTFSAIYIVTQSDINLGSVINQAVVRAEGPDGDPTNSGDDVTDDSGTAVDNDNETQTDLPQNPAISLIKTSTISDVNENNITDAGDKILYNFTLRNEGNVSLANVILTEPQANFTGAGMVPVPTSLVGDLNNNDLLDTDEIWTAKAEYTLLDGDVNATAVGFIENRAEVEAKLPGSNTTILETSKAAEDNDDVTTTFLGSVTGVVSKNSAVLPNVTVTLVDENNEVIAETVSDSNGAYFFTNMPGGTYQVRFESEDGTPFTGQDGGANDQGLQAGLNAVSSIDVAYGSNSIRNFEEVNAIAIDPSGVVYDAVSRLPVNGASVQLYYNGSPVDNSWLVGGSNTQVTGSGGLGDGVYAFFLQSPAQSGEYSIRVTAPAGYQDVAITDASDLIPPSARYDGTQNLGGGVQLIVPSDEAPIVGGDTTYHLNFYFQFVDWTDLTTLSDGVIHNHIPLDRISMGMQVTKTADVSALSNPAAVGDIVEFTITAENIGDGSYSNVIFDDPATDDNLEIPNPSNDDTLDPGETWTWTASYTLTLDDLAAGQIENTATISGETPANETETYESSENGNSTEGVGNGSPTVVDLGDLIPLIEEDLKKILADDLAATMKQQSSMMQSYAADARRSLIQATDTNCGEYIENVIGDRDIHFSTASHVILKDSHILLDEIAHALMMCDASDVVTIEGHTDHRGSEPYNQSLSERRSMSVKRALIERGIASDQLEAFGFGESRPIASNDTIDGMSLNRRVEFISRDNISIENEEKCSENPSITRDFGLAASNRNVSASGSFNAETSSCSENKWNKMNGKLSVLETDDGFEQSMFNLSFRTEKLINDEFLRGWFVGAYGARNQVTELAEGEINGMGINGGLYGARKLDRSLTLDYYAGAAFGKHDFSLTFERDFEIDATGDYTYTAYFGGVAVAGDIEVSELQISPRAGLDIAYTEGADVDVTASNLLRSEAGSLRLNSMSGTRLFGEITFMSDQKNKDAHVGDWMITPKVFCDQPLRDSDLDCGYGAQLGYSLTDAKYGGILEILIAGEKSQTSTSASLELGYKIEF